MSSAVVFLVVALLAAVGGSVVLWLSHRVRESGAPDFQEQLRALAPRQGVPRADQPSGIVHLDPGSDEER